MVLPVEANGSKCRSRLGRVVVNGRSIVTDTILALVPSDQTLHLAATLGEDAREKSKADKRGVENHCHGGRSTQKDRERLLDECEEQARSVPDETALYSRASLH